MFVLSSDHLSHATHVLFCVKVCTYPF